VEPVALIGEYKLFPVSCPEKNTLSGKFSQDNKYLLTYILSLLPTQ